MKLDHSTKQPSSQQTDLPTTNHRPSQNASQVSSLWGANKLLDPQNAMIFVSPFPLDCEPNGSKQIATGASVVVVVVGSSAGAGAGATIVVSVLPAPIINW